METRIESLKMASGSVGFGEEDDDNDGMVEKHESGYRVTLHTALMMIESAKLDDGDSSGSVVYSWTSNPNSEPRVRDMRKMAKMEMAVRRDFFGSPIWVPVPSHALSLHLSWLCHGHLIRERVAETRSLSFFYFLFLKHFNSFT